MVAIALQGRQLTFIADNQFLPGLGDTDVPLPVTPRAASRFDAGVFFAGTGAGHAQRFMEQKAEGARAGLQLGFGLELPGLGIE